MKKLFLAGMLAALFAVPAQAQIVLKVHSFSGPQAPDQAPVVTVVAAVLIVVSIDPLTTVAKR